MPLDNRRINGPDTVISPFLYTKPEISTKPVTKRKDGRQLLDCRRLCLKIGVIKEAKGSAYVEIGKTKIICSIYGPREITKTQNFSNKAQLFCEFKFAPFSCIQHHGHQISNKEKEMASILKEALEPVICLHKFPKCTIDIFVFVLENDGNVLSSGITCAGAALTDAGIDMYDLIIGCSLRQWDNLVILDPLLEEEYFPNDSNVDIDNGNIMIAFMPSLKQVAAIHLEGEFNVKTVHDAIKLLMDGCWNIYPIIQQCLIQTLKNQLKEQNKL